MNPLKYYLEEIKKVGYFLDFRPYSLSLLSNIISKLVGGSQNLDINKKGVNLEIKKPNWGLTIGNKISIKGDISQNEFLTLIGAISIWKQMINKIIYEDIKKYPIDGFHAWCTYMESKNFGFFYLKQLLSPKYKFENGVFKRGNKKFEIKEGKEKWDKRAYDYSGNFKLGGAFVSSFDKEKISNEKEFLSDVLKSISFFFNKKDEFERGKLEGDILEIGKFRAGTLKLAKKNDIIAQRVYTTLLDGRPIKSTDFEYLKNKIDANVKLISPGLKYSYKDI